MRPKQSLRSAKPTQRPRVSDKLTRRVISFPAAWLWFMDELVPSWVKSTYSPRESWKDKPFGKEDAGFFFKGVEDLSELFTEERPSQLPNYFNHPKYRSAYLLYFLPLQAAKFITLFDLHRDAALAAIEHGQKKGKLQIADLGAGPGTASIAFLLWMLQEQIREKKELPPVEFHWFDINRSILQDGEALVEKLSSQFPKLRGKVTVHCHTESWWDAPAELPEELSLCLIGNVLNEAALPRALVEKKSSQARHIWEELMSRTHGGGVLMVEPAARRSSQLLSKLRDELIETSLVPESPESIWGPCLHAGHCPLAEGRDWCHFSVPAQIPGKWFLGFSKGLGSERQWVKFSYLWLASAHDSDTRAPIPSTNLRRVLSDPLKQNSEEDTLLLCEPDAVARIKIPATRKVRRGDLLSLPGAPSRKPKENR